MRAETEWIKGLEFRTKFDTGTQVVMDEIHGGNGPTPMQLLLAALSGCTGMDVISILEKYGQKPEEFKIIVEAERRNSHPKVYKNIKLIYRLKGKDLDEEKVYRAIELSKEKYCSVMATLRCTAEITTEVEILR